MAGGYSNWEQEKMNRQYREAQAASQAQEVAKSQQYGTKKNKPKAKSDWFGLAVVAVVVVVVILALILR